jgi:Methyltransferase domain
MKLKAGWLFLVTEEGRVPVSPESCSSQVNFLKLLLYWPANFASESGVLGVFANVFREGYALNEWSAVRTSTQVSAVAGATERHGSLQMPPDRKPLLSLARKLHENETALALMRIAFRLFQRAGISVSPNHYYWPVPDYRELQLRRWPGEQDPIGVDLGFERQLDFLHAAVSQYQTEWESDSAPLFSVGYEYGNGFFETVDAEIAYCLVRHYKPLRIVEVGGGYSSRVMAAALDVNLKLDAVRGDLVTIDPYPDRFPQKALSDRVQLIGQAVQNVDLDVFLSLQSGDVLFLDSSHVVGIGSDVVREYLEIIPRIAPGVLIHAHDIFIPGDYPRDAVLHNLAFWSEQYLLQALLMFNPRFEVLWGSSYMQSRAQDALDNAFPHWRQSYCNMPSAKRRFLPTRDGDRVWPSSFWMRKLA